LDTPEIENIIKEVSTPSRAEEDRSQIKSIRSLNLIAFVDAQISKAAAENKLKSFVTTKLFEMLQKPDEEIDITTLTHLLGVLSKTDNEFALGLISTIKDFYQIEKEDEGKGADSSADGLTAGDIASARKFFKLVEKIDASERSNSEE
jgi:hypothetical protein